MIPFDCALIAIASGIFGLAIGAGSGVFFALRTVATWDLDTLGQEESRCR